MPSTFEALKILFFLLPGFVTLKVIEKLNTPQKVSDIHRITDALVFSFVNYVIFRVSNNWFGLNLEDIISKTEIQFNAYSILYLLIIASVLGFLIGWISDKTWAYKFILRKYKFTNKTGKAEVWDDAFTFF